MTYILIAVILILLFCISISFINSKNKPVKNKTPKYIKEYSNAVGEKYWVVFWDFKSTKIKWSHYEDALFYYNHIIKKPSWDYIYQAIEDYPYYTIYMDKCKMYVVDEPTSHPTSVHYDKICPHGQVNKYVMFTNNNNYKSLKDYYNNIIQHDLYEEKIVLSNKNEKDVQDEIELSITNNDIKALQKIIQEYSDSVKLSQIIAEKLIDSNKK